MGLKLKQMNNLNEAWGLLKTQQLVTQSLYGVNPPGDQRSELISEYQICPTKEQFDRYLADFCMRHSEMLSDRNHLIEISTNFRKHFVFLVTYQGTWDECVLQENKMALKKVCGNTDWKELYEQKRILAKLQQQLDSPEFAPLPTTMPQIDALEGVLNWMDYIQDFAVDKAGMDEKEIFPGLEREEEIEPTAIIDSTKGYEVRDESGIIGYVKSGDMFQVRLHKLVEDDRDVDEFNVDEVIPNTYSGGYKIKFTVDGFKEEIQLIPTKIY